MSTRFPSSRRDFLRNAGIALAGLQLSPHTVSEVHEQPALDPSALPAFVDPLPLPPLLQPSGRRPVLFSYLMLTLIPAIVCAVLLYLIRVS